MIFLKNKKRQEAEAQRIAEFSEWQNTLKDIRARQTVTREVIEELKGGSPTAEKLQEAKTMTPDLALKLVEAGVRIERTARGVPVGD